MGTGMDHTYHNRGTKVKKETSYQPSAFSEECESGILNPLSPRLMADC